MTNERVQVERTEIHTKQFREIPELAPLPLECSKCGVVLLNLYKTADADITLSFQADCPFCGDHSFVVQVRGMVSIECGPTTSLADFVEKIVGGENVTLVQLYKK